MSIHISDRMVHRQPPQLALHREPRHLTLAIPTSKETGVDTPHSGKQEVEPLLLWRRLSVAEAVAVEAS